MARNPYPSELADRFQVRMPEGLRDRIAKAAEANSRSMNAEIVAALEVAYPPEPTIEELIYYSTMLIDGYEKSPDYELLRHLKDSLKDLVERLSVADREGYPKPEMVALKDRLVAEGRWPPSADDLVAVSKKPLNKPKD